MEEGGVVASGGVNADVPGGVLCEIEPKDGESAPGTPAVKNQEDLVDVKDKDEALDKDEVDPDKVKAPGLVDRTLEEVEAVAEAIQERLDLKSDDNQGTKDQTDEQAGIFKRLLKKIGFN